MTNKEAKQKRGRSQVRSKIFCNSPIHRASLRKFRSMEVAGWQVATLGEASLVPGILETTASEFMGFLNIKMWWLSFQPYC